MGKTNPKPEQGHFMSGFTLGTLAGGAALFLFATKKGRAVLSGLMDIAEQLEEGNFDLGLINQTEEKGIEPKKTGSGGMQEVLSKIQDVTASKTFKKYFVKEE